MRVHYDRDKDQLRVLWGKDGNQWRQSRADLDILLDTESEIQGLLIHRAARWNCPELKDAARSFTANIPITEYANAIKQPQLCFDHPLPPRTPGRVLGLSRRGICYDCGSVAPNRRAPCKESGWPSAEHCGCLLIPAQDQGSPALDHESSLRDGGPQHHARSRAFRPSGIRYGFGPSGPPESGTVSGLPALRNQVRFRAFRPSGIRYGLGPSGPPESRPDRIPSPERDSNYSPTAAQPTGGPTRKQRGWRPWFPGLCLRPRTRSREPPLQPRTARAFHRSLQSRTVRTGVVPRARIPIVASASAPPPPFRSACSQTVSGSSCKPPE
jgi:hypothetical protein